MPRQKEWHRAGQASGRLPLCRNPSSKPAVFLQQGNHISDSPGVGFAWVELVAELDEIALSLALSSASRSFSLLSCYGFAGLRLHPLLVRDLPLLELDLSQLVIDNGSPIEHR